MDFEKSLNDHKAAVNKKLADILNVRGEDYDILLESMRYSALAGGKRIRSYIMREFYSLFTRCGDERIMSAACAAELIHAYSLIHDDLPCMDDDDFRRGQPSNHKKFGEVTALLAGDALLTLAFEVAADTKDIRIVRELANAAGMIGMVGGQVMDMGMKTGDGIDKIVRMTSLKTGCLFTFSARAGCIAADADEKFICAAENYALNLGIAFQVADDILDRVGDTALMGKSTGSDGKNDKVSFLSVMDLNQAGKFAQRLSEKALSALGVFRESGYDVSNLENLVWFLAEREM